MKERKKLPDEYRIWGCFVKDACSSIFVVIVFVTIFVLAICDVGYFKDVNWIYLLPVVVIAFFCFPIVIMGSKYTISKQGISWFRVFRKRITVTWKEVQSITRVCFTGGTNVSPRWYICIWTEKRYFDKGDVRTKYNRKSHRFEIPATPKNMRVLLDIASHLPFEDLRGKFEPWSLNNVEIASILRKKKK